MLRFAPVAAAILAVFAFASPTEAARERTAVSAQSRPDSIRQRPRIRVQPRYYPRRNYHTLYPLPYNEIAYPGPNAVRRCVSGLVQEHRPSGTVIVPRRTCWWAPR